MRKKLFLDDVRTPEMAYKLTGNRVYKDEVREVVTCFDEFVERIEENGIPSLVSLDHDLHDQHYTPKEYRDDYEASKKYQDEQEYAEMTGYDCAKRLIEYCHENNIKFLDFLVHSANPVGADRIRNILTQYFNK